MSIYPVILTGGAGSRLWPLSREHYPKPLLPLFGDRTMLQETALRLTELPGAKPPIFVCNEEHRFLVAEQAQAAGIEAGAILLEPEGRNTAPALTIAALYLLEQDPDAMLVVMPADHVIPDKDVFQAAVGQGIALANAGHLVTYGIVPRHAETGYGYIRRGAAIEDGVAYQVSQFVEKPDLATAQGYVDSGEYYWNSGIFTLRADAWIAEMERHAPAILEACKAAVSTGKRDADFCRVDKVAFLASPSDSIDYAVMEKTDKATVVPLDAGWSDVGAWSALWDISAHDAQGNVTQGDVLTHEVRDTLVLAQHRCVAAIGLDGVVVIETPDAVLVTRRECAQDVKEIVSQLKVLGRDEYKFHRRVFRPWGDYEGIDTGARYQVKRLTVKPGASLSLQLHHHRAEHWVVVKGTARVTRGEEVFILSENESTYIPLGTKHRLENPGTIPLEIIEVQSGSYLGEDDIVRFEDVYDRVGQSA
jgi:mannose-1-phosphate guanylyltransferase/mannose-6-phosphate isomerase